MVDGEWTAPINMAYPLDLMPALSPGAEITLSIDFSEHHGYQFEEGKYRVFNGLPMYTGKAEKGGDLSGDKSEVETIYMEFEVKK